MLFKINGKSVDIERSHRINIDVLMEGDEQIGGDVVVRIMGEGNLEIDGQIIFDLGLDQRRIFLVGTTTLSAYAAAAFAHKSQRD